MTPITLRLGGVALLAVSASLAHAIEIDAYHSGTFGADGSVSNSPGFQNHYVGNTFVGSVPTPERRNFFLFDVSGAGGPIVSAKLKLYVPKFPPDGGFGYISPDPTETYLVTSTPFTADEIATPGIPPGLGAAMFATFGMGTPYGVEVASKDSMGTDLVITLDMSAIDALNAAVFGSGKWVATGRLTTLAGHPPLTDQLLFAFTDPTGAVAPVTPYPRLEYEIVPEPCSMLALGVAGLALRRRRRS